MSHKYFRVLSGALTLLVCSSAAFAQEAPDMPPPPSAMPSEGPPPPSVSVSVTVPSPIPAPAFSANVAPAGQWVYTAQYGWVWMPVDQAYTYAPREVGGDPYMYVYYPARGWSWVAAPWIFGVGPHPYFGSVGWHRYGWYGHGGFGHTWYGYRAGNPGWYRGYHVAHPYRGGVAWRAPVVHRGGFGGQVTRAQPVRTVARPMPVNVARPAPGGNVMRATPRGGGNNGGGHGHGGGHGGHGH